MKEATPIQAAKQCRTRQPAARNSRTCTSSCARRGATCNQNAWDYIVGAAETETTMRRNRMALDEIAFRPRVLRDVAKVDASVEVFGRRLRLPVMLAPVGALEIFDPGGAASVSRGGGRVRRRSHDEFGDGAGP